MANLLFAPPLTRGGGQRNRRFGRVALDGAGARTHPPRGGDNRGRVATVHAGVTLPNPDGIFADTNRTAP